MKLSIAFAFALALWSVAALSPAEAALSAGAARRSLVPPFGTPMGGFGDRTENFEGVHDELFVRALVLESGPTRVAIIGSGLMALDAQLVQRAREKIEAATSIPASHILISCSHNHSAPYGYQRLPEGETNPILDFMVDRFAEAGIAAFNALAPARIGFAAGRLEGASRNRQQNNERVIDPSVGVLRVERADSREVIAIVFNFTAHPVIQGSRNLLLSGEFPGQACRTVEAVLGGVAIFLQGAAGDVTIHRSGDPWLEIERVGRMLAGEVIKTAETIRGAEEARLAAAEQVLALAPRELPSARQAERAWEEARSASEKAKEEGAGREILRAHEARLRMLRAVRRQARALEAGELQRPESYIAPIQVIQAGEVVIVAVPGELFVEYALEMRRRVEQLAGKPMIMAGYANGHVGYIVTPRAMRTGGYEASVARVGETAGREMTETAMRLVAEIVR